MLPRSLAYFFVCLALFAGAACATSRGPAASGPVGPEALLARADRAYNQGDFGQASLLYDQYLSRAAPGPRHEAILATAGLAAERAGRFNEAARHYQNLLTRYPDSAYSRQAAPRLPDLYLALDRPAEAYERAGLLYGAENDASLKAGYRLTQAKSLWAQGRYPEALDLFLEARRQGPASLKRSAEEGVAATLFNLSQQELAETVRQRGQAYPGPEAAYYLAYQSAIKGDLATFELQADYFRQNFPTSPYNQKIAELAADPQGAQGVSPPEARYSVKPNLAKAPAAFASPKAAPLAGKYTVAAIFPLSDDPSSRYAQDILTGLRLALAKSAGQLGLVEMDTHGEPAQAARLVAEVADRTEILAAVGPLTSREALAAAQMAQKLSVPLIAVSNRLGLTEGRPLVFRVFLTPKHQAEAVVRYAVRKLGQGRLGALYPDDAYGRLMRGYFEAEAKILGAEVTAQVTYDPKQANWAEAVVSLTGGQPARRAAASYQAKIGFESLYIPDSAANVSQILAQMAYHDVTKLTYLGTSMWLTPDLPLTAGRYLTQSVIPTAFANISQRPEAVAFREEYRNATGQEPNQFAAYGHDAGLAVLTALAAGAKDRGSLARILQTVNVPGATGPFSFDHEGDFRIEPTLLTVDRSEFKILREAGAE
ncbi:MAG: ABC transporter substrate-binding protein [Deltaproteobacteria bacterium]|jgi:branched-chain amino acid transport system substrate-binding protein|nr:ABC transporter substrate-binding protein [Deltaproteobacteria bacterium]